MDKKLVKVELTWDDGTIVYQEGADAQEWLEACNAPIILQQIRMGPNPTIEAVSKKWKTKE